MSSVKGKEIKGGSHSLRKEARHKRLSLLREKKKRRYKENTGQLFDNGLKSPFQIQRDGSSSSSNPLRCIENDMEYVNGMHSPLHDLHQPIIPGDIFRRRRNLNLNMIPDSQIDSNVEFEADTLFVEAENEGYLDFGGMDYCCENCGAMVWFEERAEKCKTSSGVSFSICCLTGKVKLPYLSRPPTLLWNLIHGLESRSVHFLENIRSYNSMFAFTSLGGKIQHGVNSGNGPPQFILGGQNYHRIGSLLPMDGQVPKFAQLYIYDTQNEVSNRMSHFRGDTDKKLLDPSLVKDLMEMIDTFNALAKHFRRVRDVIEEDGNVNVSMKLFRNRPLDARMYNMPTVDEVAALIVGDFDTSDRGRDIILRTRSGDFQRIYETDSSFIPLQYPLLFPFGEQGYQENIPLTLTTTSVAQHPRTRISLREFIAFRLMDRNIEETILLNSKRLFQQFVVDSYSMVEASRLSFIRRNQNIIRCDFLKGIEEAVDKGDVEANSIGKRVILPSSFTGGRRYMFNNCQDAMAICKKFGYPELFLTFTCNPKWNEIHQFVSEKGLTASDRPDIACRVFHMKLEQLLIDFRKGDFFGKVVAGMYTIEFQKRGLPHAHIILWLEDKDNLQRVDFIDSIISAELPDKSRFPELHTVVSNFMIHGPCGNVNPRSPCMRGGKCAKFFPKKFVDRTSFDDDGYPIYKRRDTRITTTKGGVELDNRYVVPYNPKLLMRYQAHINIEYCNKSDCIKYLFKYVNKGPDRVTVAVTTAVTTASRADVVLATINSSILWKHCKVLKLTENMRLQNGSNVVDVQETTEFSKWILDIGDGKLGIDNDGESDIEIPQELLLSNCLDHIERIVSSTYPNLMENIHDFKFFEDRAILVPTLEIVHSVNNYVLALLPGQEKEYMSSDCVCKIEETNGINSEWVTPEFLNQISCSGLPNHKIVLKVGVPVMLMRNIDQSSGLCNGTRLIVNELGLNIIGAKVATGTHVGDKVYIPRINMIPSDPGIPFQFQRRQFPLILSFAMTINKSQGQTLSHVGLYLPRPVFSHGQLYVAISRVKSKTGLKILTCGEDGEPCSIVKNVVYKEVFDKI